ncbi:unnamed protein product [Brachionus calyciflorus]|uniref:Uncharacterized protein n=1 Tax=Brachionus calyciflorus TaxID=104777 RepID=A0A814R5X8_9BILA|nr:unnamed protein product [Brachionus calyciflorus]
MKQENDYFLYEPNDDSEDLTIEECKNCSPSALNHYFGKKLFKSTDDFEKKQHWVFKIAKVRASKSARCLSKAVKFKQKNRKTNRFDYFTNEINHFFRSNQNGNLIFKFQEALKELPKSSKFIMNIYYRFSKDYGKRYNDIFHSICIYKDHDGFITNISTNDVPNDHIPYVDFDLNQNVTQDTKLKLNTIKSKNGNFCYILKSIFIFNYD